MRRRVIATSAAVGTLLAASAASATADTRSFQDSARTPGPMDIHRVTVVNEKRLTVRVKVANLQRRIGPSAGVWLDTNADRRGPEYVIFSGLYDSDWQIARARDWRGSNTGPLNCPVDQALSFDRDVIRWTTGRACLGRYSAVRVSVETHAANGTVDFSPARHRFHSRVNRN